jgi:hypothetical protein
LAASKEGVSLATRGDSRPDSLLPSLPGIVPIGRPTPLPRPDCLMTTPLSSRLFPVAGKRRHKQTALAVAIAANCIASPIPISVLSAQTQSAPGAVPKRSEPATPLTMTERDDQNPQFATVVVPATIQAFFATDLYAKAYGYVS